MNGRVDLLEKIPLLKRILKLRSFQFIVILPNLALFLFFLIAGVIGHPIGNKNIMIVMVWILWWVLLICLMVPFMGRIWCTICPLPVFGEWLQRGTVAGVKKKGGIGLQKPWPKPLRNIWVQNIGFLLLALFSALLVTRPIVSTGILGGIIVLSTVLMLIFKTRGFCLYVCPVSGFLGLYAMCSTLELRVKDKEVCRKHKGKECIRGSDKGYGCPWQLYPGTLERNNYCGLCTECLKTCPVDNIALNIRPFAADMKMKGLDEAWKAFIMLTLAASYSLVLLGPNGTLKDWANISYTGDVGGFLILAAGTIVTALGVVPGLFALFCWPAKLLSGDKKITFKEVFVRYAFVLVPMGLLVWIAFSVPLLLINGSYIVSVISDPLGWGWNLFGTAKFDWQPLFPGAVVPIQTVLVLLGLVISILKGHDVARDIFKNDTAAVRSLVPVTVFLIGVAAAFLMLFAG